MAGFGCPPRTPTTAFAPTSRSFEPFAAVLEMEHDHPFDCNYVGKIELPKGYGIFPLYRLSRRAKVAVTASPKRTRSGASRGQAG